MPLTSEAEMIAQANELSDEELRKALPFILLQWDVVHLDAGMRAYWYRVEERLVERRWLPPRAPEAA